MAVSFITHVLTDSVNDDVTATKNAMNDCLDQPFETLAL